MSNNIISNLLEPEGYKNKNKTIIEFKGELRVKPNILYLLPIHPNEVYSSRKIKTENGMVNSRLDGIFNFFGQD